jgi:ribonuclease D
MAGLDDPGLYTEKDPRLHYQRMKGTGRMSSRELAVLRELAAWREETARERDLPRGRVLADKALVHLARTQPRTMRGLTGRGRIGDRTARRHGRALLAAVQTGQAVEPDQCPPAARLQRNHGAPSALVDRALELIRGAAERQGVDTALVAARAEVRALVSAGAGAPTEEHRLLRGWRGKLVGRDLRRLLAGGEQATKSR